MTNRDRSALLIRAAVGCVLAVTASGVANAADVVRHPLPGGSTFPIARAVEVPAGKTIIFHSGTTPAPLDPKAEPGSLAYWGDTKTQALSTFARIKESLDAMKLDFGNVVAMTVYLVGDPARGGKMDFEGFMSAYTQFFGKQKTAYEIPTSDWSSDVCSSDLIGRAHV